MSCGLGAVALLLIFIKVDNNNELFQSNEFINKKNELSQERDDLLDQNIKLEGEISKKGNQSEVIDERIDIANNLKSLAKQNQSSINAKANAVRQNESRFYENYSGYVSGCNTEGKKIGIFLDSSSSMMHSKIVEILRLKSSSIRIKQQAKKWKQAKKIGQWLVEKAPEKSELLIANFSESINTFQPKLISKSNLNFNNDLNDFFSAIIPENGTNFQNLVDLILKFNLDSVYIVTDGLPTLPVKRNTRSCSSASTISPDCRADLYKDFESELISKRTKINFILLPLEGDVRAPYLMSMTSVKTRGCFITPSNDFKL